MDPVSVVTTALGIAGQAWKVGSEIYQFVQSAGKVNQTISDLAADVKALGDVCCAISETREVKSDTSLNASIEPQLTRCKAVIDKLDKALPKRLPNTNFAKQAYQQAQLNLHQDDIDEYRTQIQIISSNLQLSLQLLNIKATYLAPQIANMSLLDKLAELDNTMKAQGRKLDDTLLRYADIYITEGQTLYARSNAGSVAGITVDLQSKSTAEWVGAMQSLQKLQLDADVDAESISQHSISDRTTSSHWQNTATTASQEAPKDKAPAKELDDDDDEYELTIDLTDASLAAGRESFASGDFEEAEIMLREGLDHLQTLPENLRHTYDLDELQLKLATCAFHKNDLESALAALLGIVERQSSSVSDAAQKLEAGMLLAQTYVRMNNLDRAISTSENVYRARRRLLGKDHVSCFETVGLLYTIFELSGKTSRAAAYKKMLPADCREQYCQKFATLEVIVESNSAAQTSLPTESILGRTATTIHDSPDPTGLPPQMPASIPEPSEPALLQVLEFHGDKIDVWTQSFQGHVGAGWTDIRGRHFIGVGPVLQDFNGKWVHQTLITDAVSILALAEDASTCAWYCKRRKEIAVQSIVTGEYLKILTWSDIYEPRSIRFLRDGTTLFATFEKKIRVWNWQTGSKLHSRRIEVSAHAMSSEGYIAFMEFAPSALSTIENMPSDKSRLAVMDCSSNRHIWRSATTVSGSRACVWNEDGSQLAWSHANYITIYQHRAQTSSTNRPFREIRHDLRLNYRPGLNLDWRALCMFFLGDDPVILVQFSPKLLAMYDSSVEKCWKVDIGGATLLRDPRGCGTFERYVLCLDDGTYLALKLRQIVENCRLNPDENELVKPDEARRLPPFE